jgi:hypothetical protein
MLTQPKACLLNLLEFLTYKKCCFDSDRRYNIMENTIHMFADTFFFTVGKRTGSVCTQEPLTEACSLAGDGPVNLFQLCFSV